MTSRTRSLLIPFAIVACVLPLALSGTALAAPEDRLLAPTATQIGVFAGVPYVQYDGIFEGMTSTGEFRVPYRITAPADPDLGNRTVLVEPPHFAAGLAVLGIYLGPDLLFSRGFAHAGVGWSTASSGTGLTQRILDPSVPGVFIEGGFPDSRGRTDHEIIADFAHALGDPAAGSVLGSLSRRYVTGVSDSSLPVLDLVTSGGATNVFDLALPITTEWEDPQPALPARLRRQAAHRQFRGGCFPDSRRPGDGAGPVPVLRGRGHTAHTRFPRDPFLHERDDARLVGSRAPRPFPAGAPLGRDWHSSPAELSAPDVHVRQDHP